MKHPRRLSKILSNEQGLTLIEVLIAFLLFTLVLVTLLGNFAQVARHNSDTLRYNQALSLAQSKIEEIKEMNFDSISSIPSKDFSSESDYARFNGMSYRVTVLDSSLSTRTVTVTVAYNDGGVTRQVDLTTEVARR